MDIASSVPLYGIGAATPRLSFGGGIPQLALGALSFVQQLAEITAAARSTLHQMQRALAQAAQAIARNLAAAATMWLSGPVAEPVTLVIEETPLVPVPLQSQFSGRPARFLRDAVQPNAPSDAWQEVDTPSPGVAA